ncbi:MAG: glycosyltransferase family 4 protein, partial [Proteobacteria bacterium]|nr:glycosyltransferase family 4 protein [Pseudomonadota bacterium]
KKTYRQQFEDDFAHLSNQVKFYGKLPDHDLIRHYQNCDIFVAPSLFESFGLIFLEAMMFAKPVVGCDSGGVSEVVIHEQTGFLALPGDPNSLLDCIRKLIKDEKLRLNLGSKGRERYQKYFTSDKMAENTLKVFNKIAYQH